MNIKKLTLMAAGLLLVGNMEMSAQGLDRQATDVINEMAPGWNLGNTFEAVATWEGADFLNNKGGLKAETAWQGTKTTRLARHEDHPGTHRLRQEPRLQEHPNPVRLGFRTYQRCLDLRD